ncbi:hypothetical protein B0T17DRAFT_541407 [Bombardia bombarda]|uniref:Uncharacterized protein n=1 Tax=Bombardia bombarda TaxID=252184 RepID=A0AA39WH06_9PEZI|nr:hypothetical protein B0T17DRAFT_541407 [Bombardia bombarda]
MARYHEFCLYACIRECICITYCVCAFCGLCMSETRDYSGISAERDRGRKWIGKRKERFS